MNVCIKSTLAASILYISITGPVWAGLAAGNYTFNGGTYLPVWDLSGTRSATPSRIAFHALGASIPLWPFSDRC